MKKITLCFIVLLIAPLGASAETGEVLLSRFVSDVNTFEASFSQNVYAESGEVMQSSDGILAITRPGRFKWTYSAPYPQEIVADGKNLWIYDIELEQVTVKPLTEILTGTPFALLTSETALQENFILQEAGENDGLTWVRLHPIVTDTDFTSVEIGLNQQGIRVMNLYDQFSQKTVIQFVDVKTNHAIPAKAYRFVPPEGVDVIGEAS